MHLAHMVLAVAWLGHHQIVHFLLGTVVLRWVVTHVVCFVTWGLPCFYLGTIERTSLLQFASSECEGSASGGDFANHVWEIFVEIDLGLIVSPNINILDRIMVQETLEGTQRVHSRMRLCACLESFRSTTEK